MGKIFTQKNKKIKIKDRKSLTYLRILSKRILTVVRQASHTLLHHIDFERPCYEASHNSIGDWR